MRSVGGDGGFAPSQYVASAIRKEREKGRREGRWPPRLHFCVRSKKCRADHRPTALRSISTLRRSWFVDDYAEEVASML